MKTFSILIVLSLAAIAVLGGAPGAFSYAAAPRVASPATHVVIYDNVVTHVGAAAEPSCDLWITTEDLARATKFHIKPQGVCRDELCFPLPKDHKERFVTKKSTGRSTSTWFNLSEFARLLKQPVAFDQAHSTWYFGARPAVQNDHLRTLEAPDFTLPDVNGKMHSLSDFRGKKVMLVTWASW